jgi:hypothetical protein
MAKANDVFEVHKLAYQTAANRYDNIYRSVWTIFSYMTVVAAAILSFGGQRFYGEPLTLLGSLPLIFWFWTTYLPLNRYGDQTLENLVTIEGRITNDTGVTVDHFASFQTNRKGGIRARHAIYFFLIALHIMFVWSFCATGYKIVAGHRLVKDPPPVTMPLGR